MNLVMLAAQPGPPRTTWQQSEELRQPPELPAAQRAHERNVVLTYEAIASCLCLFRVPHHPVRQKHCHTPSPLPQQEQAIRTESETEVTALARPEG